jgi:hypothetical protein
LNSSISFFWASMISWAIFFRTGSFPYFNSTSAHIDRPLVMRYHHHGEILVRAAGGFHHHVPIIFLWASVSFFSYIVLSCANTMLPPAGPSKARETTNGA